MQLLSCAIGVVADGNTNACPGGHGRQSTAQDEWMVRGG
jgi:hypothetical protein